MRPRKQLLLQRRMLPPPETQEMLPETEMRPTITPAMHPSTTAAAVQHLSLSAADSGSYAATDCEPF
ncbi:hypothetical protein EDM56_06910 [Brevibacillus fluminis]|uniref:Uncharacterized protein n=1 Tax=Brevibacillus fluminis TaxID=511487 RepID=A0A3M8DQ55_9BACL|nr:hypothetical protein EDM56_06910 [Brevibacillus fluminis]